MTINAIILVIFLTFVVVKINSLKSNKRVVIVHWKNSKNEPYEVYSNLKNFCLTYPEFSYNTLNNYLSKKRLPYERDHIRIERKPLITKVVQPAKPNLPKRLFWEYKYDAINWKKDYLTVIERVIEKGSPAEWKELIQFYGKRKIIKTVKNEIKYLSNRSMKKIYKEFNLKPEELKCYIKKQLTPQHWI